MSDPKFTPGPDARLPFTGPHTTLDNENPDKGMLFVGVTLLYQLPAGGDGMAYSRPLIVTSVDSRNQHVSGWLLPDARRDSNPTGITFVSDAAFGQAGQENTWHWPVKGYSGRSDGPGLTPIESVERVAEVAPEPASNAPGTVEKTPTTQPLHPHKKNKHGE